MAGKAIAEVNGKGKIPILVGGTGLYVQSLLEGYDFQTARMTEADKEAAQARIDALSQEELKAISKRKRTGSRRTGTSCFPTRTA